MPINYNVTHLFVRQIVNKACDKLTTKVVSFIDTIYTRPALYILYFALQ